MLDLSPRTWLQSLIAGGLILAIALAGCAGPEKTDGPDPSAAADEPNDDDEITSSTRELADRLAEAMRGQAWEPPDDELTAKQWEAIRSRQPLEPSTPPEITPEDDEPGADEPDEAHPPAAPETVVNIDADDDHEPLTRRELLVLLREHIRNSDDSVMSRALIAAAVSLADPHHEIDPAALGALSDTQRDRVELYHQLLLTLGQELAQSDELSRHSLDRRLDELFRDHPLEIRTVALCRRVSGFGSFDTFDSQTFLAGRDQRMIVYSELDHFRPHRLDNGEYEVKLEQEVVLYNESDGLAVWRHEPVRIIDQSQNRRRDFFVVQMITLPARLSVGKYRMKVRITDVHGNSLDETTLPVEFVADASLVHGKVE